MARLNLMNTVNTPDGELAYDARPQWMNTWEKTKLLVMADANGDGKIQYYSDGGLAEAKAALATAEKEGGDVAAAQAKVDEAQQKHDGLMDGKFAAAGWKGNEITKVDNDIMVLANPEIAQLPNWVIALVAAGGIAAALSTAAGLLLAIASSIAHDLIKSIINPRISEKNELLASRITMSVAILVAGYMGLNPPGFAAQVVALAFGLAAASIFPALMMGIFSKRINSTGAIAGMLAGISITLVYIFWYKGWFFVKGTNMLADKPDQWFMGISPEAFGTVGAMVNFAVAWAVSRVTAPPPEHIQHLVEDVRVPRGAGVATGH